MRVITFALVLCSASVGCSASGGGSTFNGGGGSANDAAAGSDAYDDLSAPFDAVNLDGNVQETTVVEGGYDSTGPDPDGTSACSDAPPPPAQITTGACSVATNDECDGKSDPPDQQGNAIANGPFGNGFDDDCDGLVDEGCACDPGHPVGTTKDCYLMPSSWVDDGTKMPVGWCGLNSKGTVKCVSKGGNPEQPIREWDGECRGAQPPAGEDACSLGDERGPRGDQGGAERRGARKQTRGGAEGTRSAQNQPIAAKHRETRTNC